MSLTLPEFRHAGYVGIDRYARVLADHRTPQWGQRHDDWHMHVVGAWGECTVAKAIGCYWAGDLGRPDGGASDVGPYHVRTTLRPNGCLILHESDVDDEPFVLVTQVRLPEFRIAGWCFGYEGKVPAHWRTDTGRPAFFVPQSALRSMA